MSKILEITQSHLDKVTSYEEKLNNLKETRDEALRKLATLETELTNATLNGDENVGNIRKNVHKLNNSIKQYESELEILENNRESYIQTSANDALKKASKHHKKIKGVDEKIINNIEKTRTKLLDLLVQYQEDKERYVQELFSIKRLVKLADYELVQELDLTYYEDSRAERINTTGAQYEITYHDMISHYKQKQLETSDK